MPTYEYVCIKCSHNFEVFQKITDKALDICPKCGKKVRRIIHGGSGIIFSRRNSFYSSRRDPVREGIFKTGKGSGFYATDYRKQVCPKANDACKGCPSHQAHND